MIILLGIDSIDNTLIKIIDCLEFLGVKNYIKINQNDLFSERVLLKLNNFSVEFDNVTIDLTKKNSIFFWKSEYKSIDLSRRGSAVNASSDEYNLTLDNIFDFLSHINTINNYSNSQVSKFNQLIEAKKVGLKIPQTYLLNHKKDLFQIKKENINIISKGFEAHTIIEDDKTFITYTCEIIQKDIEALNDYFFPSIIQNKIIKDAEIRVIYFYGKTYPVAILSQQNQMTETDYRNYDISNPNIRVKFKLPNYIETKIIHLMKKLNLNFGSLDLIKTLDNEYIFLEVNTMGQFESIAKIYNIDIHMMIAEKLIELNQ
jgi:hypothetical protein